MGNRNISICMLVIGIFFVVIGSGLLWTSFTMIEGGIVRAPAILFLLVGFIVCILAIRKLLKSE